MRLGVVVRRRRRRRRDSDLDRPDQRSLGVEPRRCRREHLDLGRIVPVGVTLRSRGPGGQRAQLDRSHRRGSRLAGRRGRPGGIGAISCAGTAVCVAGNGTGQLLSSSSPSAGPTSWSVTGSDPGHWIAGLTCTTTSGGSGSSLCVATDSTGNVLTTSNPAAASPTWTTTNVNSTNVIWDVSCPVTTFCVAGDVTGSILWGISGRPPAITSVSPKLGPGAGGTSVTITGSGFSGATGVLRERRGHQLHRGLEHTDQRGLPRTTGGLAQRLRVRASRYQCRCVRRSVQLRRPARHHIRLAELGPGRREELR